MIIIRKPLNSLLYYKCNKETVTNKGRIMQPTRLEIKFSHDAEDYKVIVDVETYVKALPFNPMSFDPPDEGEL